MKLLVLLAVLAIAWFVWRKDHRATPRTGAGERSAPPGAPQEMVSCPVCGVHLPRGEALAGPDGALYCSAEHRRLRGGA
jgi:uncharacterized protein